VLGGIRGLIEVAGGYLRLRQAVGELNKVHLAQLLSYLRPGNFTLGYWLNFNVAHMRDGIRRVVYEHKYNIASRP
jgi:hypothetical protein